MPGLGVFVFLSGPASLRALGSPWLRSSCVTVPSVSHSSNRHVGSPCGVSGAASRLGLEADKSHQIHALGGPTAHCPLGLVQRQWLSTVEFQNNPCSLAQMPLSRKPGPISSLGDNHS